MEAENLGRMLLLLGLVLAAVGLLVLLGVRIPFFGRLPGDLSFRWGGGSFFFPIVSCLVLSVLLTLGVNLLLRLFNRS
jgi:cytochrome c biogenesis factor